MAIDYLANGRDDLARPTFLADLDADALEKELHASVFEHLADHLKRLALVLQRLALHARLSIVEVLGYGILNA